MFWYDETFILIGKTNERHIYMDKFLNYRYNIIEVLGYYFIRVVQSENITVG